MQSNRRARPQTSFVWSTACGLVSARLGLMSSVYHGLWFFLLKRFEEALAGLPIFLSACLSSRDLGGMEEGNRVSIGCMALSNNSRGSQMPAFVFPFFSIKRLGDQS